MVVKMKELPKNYPTTTHEKILQFMRLNPSITAREISLQLEITFGGVRYHIKKLKDSGIIKRQGSTKSGKWIIVE